jgi:hypothetical protein
MWTDDIMSNHYREQYFFLTQRLAARLAAEENSVDSAGGTTQPA